jgi:hypothetical protein
LLLNPQASSNLLIDPVGPEVLYLIGVMVGAQGIESATMA